MSFRSWPPPEQSSKPFEAQYLQLATDDEQDQVRGSILFLCAVANVLQPPVFEHSSSGRTISVFNINQLSIQQVSTLPIRSNTHTHVLLALVFFPTSLPACVCRGSSGTTSTLCRALTPDRGRRTSNFYSQIETGPN